MVILSLFSLKSSFRKKKNLIVSCVYKHPSICIQNFSELHLNPVLQKVTFENKQCVLMGDFNVDVLKTDSHNNSEFYNNLSSHFLTPHILQPTRLHCKTFIDNIFFDTLVYYSLSGALFSS